jgi:hypothetical protein
MSSYKTGDGLINHRAFSFEALYDCFAIKYPIKDENRRHFMAVQYIFAGIDTIM